jgi:hypothetical protein
MHRVILVLEQVRAGLAIEVVAHSVSFLVTRAAALLPAAGFGRSSAASAGETHI